MNSKTTPKDFFLWAGAMVALYWSVIAFIFLVFNYIDYAFPSPLSYLPPNPYDTGVGHEMASIVVLFPVYAALMWIIGRDQAADPSRAEVWVRRWALVLTLFVAGLTIVGDLVSLLNAFFSGNELTAAFLLKTLVLLLVAGGVCMHFLADLWGYWRQRPDRKRLVGYGTAALAALSICAGFVLFGTPAAAQSYRLDAQRVSDLQTIQSEILSYWQRAGALPPTLGVLNDSISNTTVPQDPKTGQPYEYKLLGGTSFQLCATFNADSEGIPAASSPTAPAPLGGYSAVDDNWQHGAGQTCFLRTINPALYPPQKSAQ
jgi:Domain of unknown function (DUF5671)